MTFVSFSPMNTMTIHNNEANRSHDPEMCQDCGIEVTPELQSQHLRGLCNGCERSRIDAFPRLLALVREYQDECVFEIQEYRDNLKEGFGEPDDLLSQIEDWQERRDRCTAVLSALPGTVANEPASTTPHNAPEHDAGSPAFFTLVEDDLHEIARDRHGRRLTQKEMRSATHFFENGIEWREPAECAVDLAVERHRSDRADDASGA